MRVNGRVINLQGRGFFLESFNKIKSLVQSKSGKKLRSKNEAKKSANTGWHFYQLSKNFNNLEVKFNTSAFF